jgi:hypothetical protein
LANVEQEIEDAIRSHDSYIANADTIPSILTRKIAVRLRKPKGKTTPFGKQVLRIYFAIRPSLS